MRLLHAWDFGNGKSVARCEPASEPRTNPRGALGKPLPLHRLFTDLRSRRSGNGQDRGKRKRRAVNSASRSVDACTENNMADQEEPSKPRAGGAGANREGLRVIGVPRRRVDGRAKV